MHFIYERVVFLLNNAVSFDFLNFILFCIVSHTGQRWLVDQWPRDSSPYPSQHSFKAALFPSNHSSWDQVFLVSKFSGAGKMGREVQI